MHLAWSIVNSGPEMPLGAFKERLRVLIGFLSRQLIVRLDSMRKMGKVLAKHLLPKPEQSVLHRTFVERWAENDKRAYLAAMGAFRGWNVTEHLQDIFPRIGDGGGSRLYAGLLQRRLCCQDAQR